MYVDGLEAVPQAKLYQRPRAFRYQGPSPFLSQDELQMAGGYGNTYKLRVISSIYYGRERGIEQRASRRCPSIGVRCYLRMSSQLKSMLPVERDIDEDIHGPERRRRIDPSSAEEAENFSSSGEREFYA